MYRPVAALLIAFVVVFSLGDGIAITSASEPAPPKEPPKGDFSQPQGASPLVKKTLHDLLTEYNAGVETIRQEMLKTMPVEEVNETLWSKGPLETLAHFGPRFLAVARENPRTDAAWEALRWVVYVRGFSREDKAAALEQMLRDHIADETFYRDLYFHLFRPGVDKEQFYREVLKRPGVPRRVAGLARFSLGVWLQRRGGDKAEAEAVALFRAVRAEYADLPHPYDDERGTLGDAAERAEFEIEHLGVGKEAPDIVGQDVEGSHFALSDYRGKVVVLVFCGEWCGACRTLYPYWEKLLEKLSHRAFAIVGVNSDPADVLRAAVERERFRFRWFSDGSTRGPIATRWNVGEWPTVYVLNEHGKIRMKRAGNEKPQEIGEAVERLLAEMQ
jgi:peroxiredoxin/transglutaminase-like putative cysteine protease